MDSLLLASNFDPGFTSGDRWLDLLFVRWPIAMAPALFTWLLPLVMRYRRGGMGRVGLVISMALSVALGFGLVHESWYSLYRQVHPWLYGIFYVYAIAGLALCGVGIYDGKRSAIWALLAVASLVTGAVADTLVWFGVFRSVPWVPWSFIGFCGLMLVAYARRPADPALRRDVRHSALDLANNLTRRSRSIPRKLLREGDLHMLPAFYLLSLSHLGHEGIERSGSFEFADHIYRNEPSGRGGLGRWIDARMLASPACEAFRARYQRARDAMRQSLEGYPADLKPLRVLAIPCGLPRDLVELTEQLRDNNPALLARIDYHGMDIDPELLGRAKRFTADCPVGSMDFHQGNALLRETFPPGPFHFVVSTGLNEFLDTGQMEQFYRNIFDRLADGGTFFTSVTRAERKSEAMMRAFELITRYRTPDELDAILSRFPWRRLKLVPHDTGLQTFVTAVK